MESLSIGISSSPIFPENPKLHKLKAPKPILLTYNPPPNPIHFTKKTPKSTTVSLKINNPSRKIKSLSFFVMAFQSPLSSFAAEEIPITPTTQDSSKINLEQILVSIDDFFNRYPFFVAGVVFVWLFVIPVTQEYLRKYKFISAIDAFKKLKDDPNAQMLDIRDSKSLRFLGSPNLKMFNKNVLQVEFVDGDEEGFVKKVKDGFMDPVNTTVCILDNFDGDSMKVSELLFNNGFKEAYAIRGGVRGTNGWLEIQETLLPPSVHIFPNRKAQKLRQVDTNGAIKQQSKVKNQPDSVAESKQTNNDYVITSTEPNTKSSSPYPMYPDMKPPSSPTPSKPQ